MKKIICLLILLPFIVQSQEIFQKEISHTHAFSISDMVEIPGGDYLGCGTVSPSGYDSSMSVIFKTDPLMQLQWCKRLKMLRRDDFVCITPLTDGNYLTAGASRYNSGSDYGGNLYKIDASGSVIWNLLYSKDYDDRTIGVFEQADQTLVLFIRHGVFGEPTKILKTDASGNILSQFTINTLPSNKGVSAEAVISDNTGNYFFGGRSSFNTTGNNIFFVAKTTDNSLVWYYEYDFGRDFAHLYGIAKSGDGNIVVTGNIADSDNSSVHYCAVMKIDQANGSVIWAKEIKQAEAYNQIGYNIVPLAANELMLYGRAVTLDGTEAFAAKLEAAGNISWAKAYSSGPYNYFSYGRSLTYDRYLFIGKNALNAGAYIVQAASNGDTPCNFDPLDLTAYDISVNMLSPETFIGDPGMQLTAPAYEVSDLTLSENVICSGMVAVEETAAPPLISIYPNPALRYIAIENIEGCMGGNIEMFNLQGKLCFKTEYQGQRARIEPHLPPGMYFILITGNEGQKRHQQKVIIQ